LPKQEFWIILKQDHDTICALDDLQGPYNSLTSRAPASQPSVRDEVSQDLGVVFNNVPRVLDNCGLSFESMFSPSTTPRIEVNLTGSAIRQVANIRPILRSGLRVLGIHVPRKAAAAAFFFPLNVADCTVDPPM
jgi:hypothetical protein